MPDENPSRRLPRRLIFLVAGFWVFIALFTFLFVNLVFPLAAGQRGPFALVFWVGVTLLGSGSVFVVRWLCRSLVVFLEQYKSGEDLAGDVVEDAARSARTLYMKMGLVGLAGPVILMLLVAALLHAYAGLNRSNIIYFFILGLFDSAFMAMIFFLLTQMWTGDVQGIISRHRRGARSGRVVSLKLKLGVLGMVLATMPTLLVGAMSFFTADRLLGHEMGNNLAGKLSQVNNELKTLITSGLQREDIEYYLTDESAKLGPKAYIHFGTPGGDFYRSSGAEPLQPALSQEIMQQKTKTQKGVVVDPATSVVYAFAFTEDGKWVAIAPLQAELLSKTTSKLFWLIVGITLASMLIAMVVGYFFAANIGSMVGRMAQVTEEVAQGELTRDVQVISDDELGVLGASLSTMTNNLRRMVRNVSELASQIASTCNQLLVKASAISTGAEVQSQSVHETSEAVEDLNNNIQAASENLQSLAQSSQETAEAAQKVGESFNLMLAETAGLTETVENTGSIVSRMVASVNEVAGSINELSQGAERSAVSMSEMDRSISEVSSSASDTAQIARKAIDVAQEGAVAVRRTIEGMDRIVSSTREASSVIVGLGNRIEDIGSILGVIDEIADQTNLLALNAAIIAAQAGEHGRSFAVVADEIRSLAERTAASTREINQMIMDIQQTSEEAIKTMRGSDTIVNDGVSLAKQAGDALNQILISFQRAVENVESIAGYTEGQARSSMTVAREIGHVAEMAGRISQAAGEQTSAGQELQGAFHETLKTTQSMSKMVNQQAQENRQAIAAVAEMNESTTRVNQALLDQSKVSDGILQAIEQVREIAKNHAKAASEMGEATQYLADKSARLKEEIDQMHA